VLGCEIEHRLGGDRGNQHSRSPLDLCGRWGGSVSHRLGTGPFVHGPFPPWQQPDDPVGGTPGQLAEHHDVGHALRLGPSEDLGEPGHDQPLESADLDRDRHASPA